MIGSIPWLPEFFEFSSYSNNWERYCEALYKSLCKDFKDERVVFRNTRVFLSNYPICDGKENGFWHCISEGDDENSRIPDFERCRRIRWPKAIIVHDGDPGIKIWENIRKGYHNYCILLDQERYLVVIRVRDNKWLLWTAYLVTYNHTYRKLINEYNEYIKNNAAI